MNREPDAIRGRGAADNPPNRFESTWHEYDLEEESVEDEPRKIPTVFHRDLSRSIIATNQSPDVGFDASINPYRGCEHGCIYCYARPTHETLGFSAGLDFETQIMVKEDAPELLRQELSSRRWVPKTIAMSGVTDPYQPAERRLKITRGCLEVLAEFRNPVGIVTKNRLVARDRDLLAELSSFNAARVYLSVTSLDAELARKLEPRTSSPALRLRAIEELTEVGIQVGVMVAPVIPGLTDHEIPAILEACAKAGARYAGCLPVRLPLGVTGLFQTWLEQHFPDRKDKVLNRIRSIHGGTHFNSPFGDRMRGQGTWAEAIRTLFHTARDRAGLSTPFPPMSTTAFRRQGKEQRFLFQ
jgi:DNA repair photolyase